ncbi:MAG: dipicolinate synthase subunit B [Clostridiales bacterium]
MKDLLANKKNQPKNSEDTPQYPLDGLKIAFALTGSYCTLDTAISQMGKLRQMGAKILPIISHNVKINDTRFGTAASWKQKIEAAAGTYDIIDNIIDAEPIGPQAIADILVIAPCSGNTLGKLANGITDTPVVMAAKSHLRNSRPLLLAVATNDGLSNSCKNIGLLLNSKNIYFVPFGQDDAFNKANSLVADINLLPESIVAALAGKQIQPILL